MLAAQRGFECALTSDEDDSDFWGYAHEARGLFTLLRADTGRSRYLDVHRKAAC